MDIPVQYYDEPGGTAGVEEGEIFNHRRPLLFDGSTLYVGGFGQYHEEAMAAHDLDRPGAGDIPCGAWFPHGYEDRTKPHVKKEPGHIAWFSNMIKPEYRAQIAKQLGGHDVDLSTEWSFHPEAHPVASNALRVSTQGDTLPEPSQGLRTPQNASVHQLDWVPGATGKGYVDEDGAVRTWNTDGNGRPHHAEVQMGVPYENEAAFPNAYALGRMRSWPFTIGADGQFSWAWDQKRRDKPPVHPSDVDPRLESLFEDDMPGEWRFGSHTHRRVHGPPETYANDWTPGNYGKAIAYTNPDTGERELWHWSVGTGEDGDTADHYPHHIDYQNLTSTNPGTRKEYGILPNGIAAPVWSNSWDDGDHELFDAIGAQPGAQSHDYDPWQNDQWHFAVIENGDAQQHPDAMNSAPITQPAGFTAYETPPGLQPWVEGGPGKGLLLRDGKRYAWATDRWGDGYPHHLKAIQAIGIPEARQYLDDHPVRAYMTHYQNGWADWPSLGEDYHLWSGRDDKAESNEWKFGNRDFSLLNHLVNNPYVEGDGVNYHTWTPGNRGKGMILPDGRPATWNIENTEPATYAGPHHRQVAEYLGVGSYPQVSDEAAEEDRQIDIENGFEPEPVAPGWHTPIYINPDGTYGTLDRVWNSDRWHTDNGHPAFDQLGLTREHEDNGWTFGKVAWKWNQPWEVQIHEDATGSVEPDFVTEGSRPILYDNNNKIVHIGPMHRYHADLYRHLGVPHIPDVHQGRAFADDFTIGTYDRTAPEALQAAANALNENDGHTRWMPSSNDVPEHWAFGKVTPKGKVIPFPDDSYAVQGTYDGDRIPFLYGHDSGNFYLGRPGDYHYQVEGEHNPPEVTAHGMLYSNATHDWYTRPVNEPDMSDVINTVRAHPSYEGFFRKDAPLPEQQGHEWTFSRVADMVEGDEEEVVALIGQQAYDEWQFAPRRASRSEGQTWLDVVDGTVDRSWPSHADAVTDTSDKRDEETDDKATHKADTATFTPSKLTPHDAPLSPIPTHLSHTPLVPPTADHDSGAYEAVTLTPPTSSLALFLASLTPSDEEDDLDPYPIDSGRENGSMSLTSSTPITLINNQGEVGHTDGHRPADMYQVGGARDTAAQPGPGHSDSNAQQGDSADNRPSHKRMVRVQSIREAIQISDAGAPNPYHNEADGTPREPQGDNVPQVPFHNYDEPQAGKPWKGLVMKDGTRYHWGVDEDLSPHHSDALWGLEKSLDDVAEFTSSEGQNNWTFGAFEDQRVPGIPHWVNGGHGQNEWEEGYETLPWTEGQYGKGFTMNGDVHTWAVDHGDPYSGEPHHEEVLNTLGHSWDSSFTPFQIDPQGNVTHLMSDRLHPQSRELINSIPKLNVNDEESHEDSDWHFSATEVEPWELGHNGKGVFLKDGTPAIWKVDQGGYPMHGHDGTPGWDECENGWNNSFHVDQFGKAGFWFPDNIQKHHGPALAEKGIELDDGQKAGWVFGKVSEIVDGLEIGKPMNYDEFEGEGKGVTLEDGRAFFWPTYGDEPHHGEFMEDHKINPRSVRLYHYRPAGEQHWLNASVPPLSHEWVFSKTATTVVRHEGDPWFDGKDLTASMIYDPDADEVHYATGDNIYHRDIDTGNPNNEYGFIDYDHNALHWYHGEPMDEAKARGALSEHLGIPLQKAVETEDGWKFGSEFPLNVEWMGSAADYAADHSLMIHPQQRRMVIGAPEFHHSDLIERYGQDGWMTGAIYDGELHTHDDPHNPLWDSVELYANRMNDMFGYPPVTRNKDEWKFSKTASKLDWLESRPDKAMATPEGKQFFDNLKVNFHTEKTDPLFPWVWREYRKGRLQLTDRTSLSILDENGRFSGWLTPAVLTHWADWFADKRNPTRRGVDLMQLTADNMIDKINEWDEHNANQEVSQRLEGGKVLKTLPNGWTVRELEPDDLQFEGNEMGHCVGGEGYRRAVENGHTKIISLRDPQGHPHATMELENNTRIKPGVQGRHVIEQVQGKGNEIPKPEYQAMLKQWITELPEGERPVWKNEVEAISDLNEIVSPEEDDDPHGWGGYAPHGDYGIPLPPRQTDYDSVISDLHRLNDTWRGYGHYDPSHGEALYNHAVQRNEIPQLAKAFQGYQDKAFEDMQDMEDNNMDWLQYPGEYEDQPEFWDKIGQEDGISGRAAQEQAYENYSEARSELAENVPSYQAANHMGDLLSHHWDADTGAFVNKPGVFSSWNFG